MTRFIVLCGLLLLAASPVTLGARKLSATGTGVLPQPADFSDLGSVNAGLMSGSIPVTQAAAAAAPAPAADQAAPAAAQAPTVSLGAAFSAALAPALAPGPAPSRRRRRATPKNSVFILDADYATLSVPDPDAPEEGTLELTGFSHHVSYFTDARGAGVRRSGRLPISSFANVSFPGADNATANGSSNATTQPNAALYSNSETAFENGDQLLRLLTLRGKPSVDSTNTTLTFNVTLAPDESNDDTVTVYRVSFNQTANGTDVPHVSEQEYGTTATYESVALYVGRWEWGMENGAANVHRLEQRREERREAQPWGSSYYP